MEAMSLAMPFGPSWNVAVAKPGRVGIAHLSRLTVIRCLAWWAMPTLPD